jgi:hypothetical protein
MRLPAMFVAQLRSATATAINASTAATQWDAHRFKNEILNVFKFLKRV